MYCKGTVCENIKSDFFSPRSIDKLDSINVQKIALRIGKQQFLGSS